MSTTPSITGIMIGFPVAFIIILVLIKAANTDPNSRSSQSSHNLPSSQQVIQRQRAIPLDSIGSRQARQEQRIRWARDDLESARGEKGRLIAGDAPIDTLASLSGTQRPKRLRKATMPSTSMAQPTVDHPDCPKDRFMKLPLELRIQVYSQLDYGTVLRLAATCRMLYFDSPSRYVDPEQRATYVYHAETFPHNMQAQRLACYSCLRVKSSRCFRVLELELMAFGSRELERMCFDCRVEKGDASRTAIFMWKIRKFLRLGGE